MWSITDDAARINWHEAMSRFGSRLPSKRHGEALVRQAKTVDDAILAFGGTSMVKDKYGRFLWYWTKEECDSALAWGLGMKDGKIYSGNKDFGFDRMRVRLVSAIP